MSTATVGRSAEHYVKHRYQQAGMIVVRAAGSKGIADLIATDPESDLVVYISVKKMSWPGREEMAGLHALAERCAKAKNSHVVVYRRNDRKPWAMRIVHPALTFFSQGRAWWPDVSSGPLIPKITPEITDADLQDPSGTDIPDIGFSYGRKAPQNQGS